MNAGLFDMFHDSGDKDIARIVRDGIDIDFDRMLQKLVDQNRIISGNAEQFSRLKGASQRLLVRHDDHAASAEYVGGRRISG